jgi:membrane protein
MTAPEAEEGRGFTRPSQFRWSNWRRVLGRAAARIGPDHLWVMAAGIAFWGMLAIFPAIAALISVYGLVSDPAQIVQHMERLQPLLPADAYGVLSGQVQALIDAGAQGRLGVASVIALLFALWSARTGVAAMMDSLNLVYQEQEGRSIVTTTAISLALTLLILLVAISAMVAMVAVPAYVRIAEPGPVGTWVAHVLPWPILMVAVVFAIGAVYRYGPHRATAKKRWVTWGSVMATALWVAASLLFTFYVANFADYNKTYGSLGAIVVLLLWFYIAAFAVLLGAELNAEMELHTDRDTTSGEPEPIGERGAYVADHVE